MAEIAYPSREQLVTMQQFLAHYLGEALVGPAGLVAAIADLDGAQLHFRPTEGRTPRPTCPPSKQPGLPRH